MVEKNMDRLDFDLIAATSQQSSVQKNFKCKSKIQYPLPMAWNIYIHQIIIIFFFWNDGNFPKTRWRKRKRKWIQEQFWHTHTTKSTRPRKHHHHHQPLIYQQALILNKPGYKHTHTHWHSCRVLTCFFFVFLKP